MLIIKISLAPQGDTKRSRDIGHLEIYNDSTGTEELGNYVVHLYDKKHEISPEKWRLEGVPRSTHAIELVAKALAARFPSCKT